MNRPLAVSLLLLVFVAGFSWADWTHDRDAEAAALTVTLGLSPDRQCALARPFVRIPIPGQWDLTCHRSTEAYSWGETTYTDWDRREVARIDLHLRDGISIEQVAELMAHEVAHGYVSGTHRGGDPSDDWVADHEPFIDHFARCVTTRTAPCNP